tara:strand:- start:687 stop:917 length:231 start_codon:yes stop_codon:yes gene_type:complete
LIYNNTKEANMARKIKRWKNKEHSDVLGQMATSRGADRELFFTSGGTSTEWRGIKSVTTDRKKKKSKSACRGKVNY